MDISPKPENILPKPEEPKILIPEHTTARNVPQQLLVPIIAVLLVLVIIVGVGYQSLNSLPGDKFYPVKVGFVEPTIRLTKLTSDDRSNYDINRMKARLDEMKVLMRDDATTTPETLETMGRLIDSYTNDALDALNSDSSLSYEERIIIMSELSNVSQAEETLAKTFPEFEPMRDLLGESQGKITDSLESLIETFASTSPSEDVNAFLSAQINEVSEAIKEVAQGSNAQKQAISRINNANEDIIDGKTSNAIVWLVRAKQSIAVDQYLWDSERGPLDGEVIPQSEIPEGS